jgi:hypothetical protein
MNGMTGHQAHWPRALLALMASIGALLAPVHGAARPDAVPGAKATPPGLTISLQLAALPRTITLCRDPAVGIDDDYNIDPSFLYNREYRWVTQLLLDGGDVLSIEVESALQRTCAPYEVATESALSVARVTRFRQGRGFLPDPGVTSQLEVDFIARALILRLDLSHGDASISPGRRIYIATSSPYQEGDSGGFAPESYFTYDTIPSFKVGAGTVQVVDPQNDIALQCDGCSVDGFSMLDLVGATVGPGDGAYTPIGAGATGVWYAPSQSGHGFSFEVLPGDPPQLLAYWYVFGPQGGQAWIVGAGPLVGNRAELQAYQASGSGALFPPAFDAAQVHAQPWGTLTVTFSGFGGCNLARAAWVPTAAGYTSGGIDLVRLTQPARLTCGASEDTSPW